METKNIAILVGAVFVGWRFYVADKLQNFLPNEPFGDRLALSFSNPLKRSFTIGADVQERIMQLKLDAEKRGR